MSIRNPRLTPRSLQRFTGLPQDLPRFRGITFGETFEPTRPELRCVVEHAGVVERADLEQLLATAVRRPAQAAAAHDTSRLPSL